MDEPSSATRNVWRKVGRNTDECMAVVNRDVFWLSLICYRITMFVKLPISYTLNVLFSSSRSAGLYVYEITYVYMDLYNRSAPTLKLGSSLSHSIASERDRHDSHVQIQIHSFGISVSVLGRVESSRWVRTRVLSLTTILYKRADRK